METISKIARWGLFPLSLILNFIGNYLTYREILTWGIPAWLFNLLSYILLLLVGFSIVFGFWKENKQLKKQVENVKHEDLRVETAKYRANFIQKKDIASKIVRLDKHLKKKVSQQEISVKEFFEIVLRWYSWYEIPYLTFNFITYSSPMLRNIFKKSHYKFVMERATKLNGVLREYSKGTEIYFQTPYYQKRCEAIRDMAIGLSPVLINKVNQTIIISSVLRSMTLLNLKEQKWKQVKYRRVVQPLYMFMRTGLNTITFRVDSAMSQALAEISQGLEDYFLGK